MRCSPKQQYQFPGHSERCRTQPTAQGSILMGWFQRAADGSPSLSPQCLYSTWLCGSFKHESDPGAPLLRSPGASHVLRKSPSFLGPGPWLSDLLSSLLPCCSSNPPGTLPSRLSLPVALPSPKTPTGSCFTSATTFSRPSWGCLHPGAPLLPALRLPHLPALGCELHEGSIVHVWQCLAKGMNEPGAVRDARTEGSRAKQPLLPGSPSATGETDTEPRNCGEDHRD